MAPWFIAVECFGPPNGDAWRNYLQWSGLHQLTELISLDSILCPTVFPDVEDSHWGHIVEEDYLLCFFTDLPFLRQALEKVRVPYRLLCVFRNPTTEPKLTDELRGFSVSGYDLIEADGGGVSALTNCGGFPKSFRNEELNSVGLIPELDRAVEVQAELRARYPEEHHADCDVWAVCSAPTASG